jgi:hypothetical protein
MSIVVELPDTFATFVSKINESWDVTVHPDSVAHLVAFAVKQTIANSHAAVARDKFPSESVWKDQVRADAMVIRDKIANGTVGIKGPRDTERQREAMSLLAMLEKSGELAEIKARLERRAASGAGMDAAVQELRDMNSAA